MLKCDVQVDQADELADPRVEVRVKHWQTVRADTANVQVASPSMEVPSMFSTPPLLSVTSSGYGLCRVRTSQTEACQQLALQRQ